LALGDPDDKLARLTALFCCSRGSKGHVRAQELEDGPRDHHGDEMEALTKAVADLETSLAKAPNEAVRQHLQSAVTAMRTAIDAHRDPLPPPTNSPR